MTESRPTAESAEYRLDRAAAEAAVNVAVRAPSIHNTQPWRWVSDGEALTLLADRSRQLRVADPSGHSLLISCGAAAVLTELGLRAAGWRVESTLFPNPNDKDVLARFRAVGRDEPDEALQAQIDAAMRRQSDRRPFSPEDVTDDDMVDGFGLERRVSRYPGAGPARMGWTANETRDRITSLLGSVFMGGGRQPCDHGTVIERLAVE